MDSTRELVVAEPAVRRRAVARRGKRRTEQARVLHAVWGRRLRTARMCRNLTQTQLAGMIGVGQNTVSRIETGAVSPSDALKLRLADTFERPLADLFPWPPQVALDRDEGVA